MAVLDVAIFVRNAAMSDTKWYSIDLAVPAAQLETARRHDATFTVKVPVASPPRQVLAVVYEFSADIVSAAYARRR